MPDNPCPVCGNVGMVRVDGSSDLSEALPMKRLLAECVPCEFCKHGEIARSDFKKWKEEWSKPLHREAKKATA